MIGMSGPPAIAQTFSLQPVEVPLIALAEGALPLRVVVEPAGVRALFPRLVGGACRARRSAEQRQPAAKQLGRWRCSPEGSKSSHSGDQPQHPRPQRHELAGVGVAQRADRQVRVVAQDFRLQLDVRQRRRGNSDIALNPTVLGGPAAEARLAGSIRAAGLVGHLRGSVEGK
jgi:hypothetical protein